MAVFDFTLGTFLVSVGALFYTYVGYPLIVYVFGLARPLRVAKQDIEPRVTVIITAYNEEQVIAEKIKNTLALDYPKDKLEIIVASDGSTDSTDKIVSGLIDKNVRLFRQDGRVGKTLTQNKAVEVSTGDIILFSDATTMYQSNVLRKLLPNFADENVGCVAGKLIYVDPKNSNVGHGAKSYWNYETFLKESESRACSLIGVSGCLYAVRRSAYQPMYAEACSDFLICTEIYKQGLRSVYEPQAICSEETNRLLRREFRMRIRVVSQTLNDLWRNRRMMNPLQSGFFAFELVSHKLLRYSAPFFLIAIFISSGILAFGSLFFGILFLLQVLLYLVALVQILFDMKGARIGIFAMPLYFALANGASLVGFFKWISGEKFAQWEPFRDTKDGIETKTSF